jgi:uncharacterized RDD family membrane protein YckC
MERVDPRQAGSLGSDERMTVRTPEHVELRFVLAGPGNRFLALLMDLLLQWLLFLGILLALWGAFWVTDRSLGDVIGRVGRGLGGWIFAGFVLAFFALQWGYFTAFETIWAGQTPGKRRQRIRVIRENGRPIGFAEAAIRNLLRTALDSQPFPLHAVGFLAAMLNPRFKRLGDYAAGTVVIVERRRSAPKAAPRLRAAAPPLVPAAQPRVRQLTPEEVATLQAYLRRRDELDPAVRSAMARKIAISLGQRLGATQPRDMTCDAFLESLEREVRAGQAFG